jgi:hypothetical protein
METERRKMKAYRVAVDDYEPCITFARNRRAAKWNAVQGMRRAGYYLATKKSEQRRFPKKLKVRRAPEYDAAPIEDRYKEQRRSYSEDYIKSLFRPKRTIFSAASDGKGGLMVVDRYQKRVTLAV